MYDLPANQFGVTGLLYPVAGAVRLRQWSAGVISVRVTGGGDRGGAGRVGHFNCTEMVLLVE